MPLAPWQLPRGLETVVDGWVASGVVHPCLVADRLLEPSAGHAVPLPDLLDPRLRHALESRKINTLYTHQAEALRCAIEGRHVLVATPTASGKSLCFHLPVLQTFTRDPEARALYIYPTKALSRDQDVAVGELIRSAGLDLARVVYDGDTPGDARRKAREHGGIIMTNPDMLSAGILPQHAQWAKLFQSLRYVVIDELHTYRGVFGSHMAHVIARLVRIARFHGSSPVFLCATATIGNPREHAARLLGVDAAQIALLDRSGAPSGSRRLLVYNPPVVNAELGIRASYLKSAVRLAGDLLDNGVPTIVFGPSRNSVEIMLKYLRERLQGQLPADRIVAYRGGYLPETRRQIERDLRSGRVLGVVSTNALELGIDIGSLDAVICAGYPGSIAATWQRFGRAGRRSGRSVAVMVASSAAIDQYFTRNPGQLLDASAEEARIDPSNVEIVLQHLKCAAFELPFAAMTGACADGEAGAEAALESYACLDRESTRDALRFLGRHGVVHEAGGRFHWAADAYPANHVPLRSVGWDNYVIIDRTTGKAIAELDWRATHTMLHEQAIYQHDGEQYQVEKLDYENHKAYVTRVEPDYFTTALTHRVVSVLRETASSKHEACSMAWGEVSVVEKVTGYKKIKFFTHENAGYGDVRLPDMQMHTTSFWLTVPEALFADLGRASCMDALGGIGRALETVATIALMCEPSDIGQSLGDKSPETSGPSTLFEPTLFLFDHVPGGIGLAERIYERAPQLFPRTLGMIEGCACLGGCPACIGPADGDRGSRKKTAIELLRRICGQGESADHDLNPSALSSGAALRSSAC